MNTQRNTQPNNHPEVLSFYDKATNTISYIVIDPATKHAAIVDSVLDYDPKAGRVSTASADEMIAAVKAHDLTIDWIVETHVHADHFSAAQYLQQHIGSGVIGIGGQIAPVQSNFADMFDMGIDFKTDGSQFDHLFQDGESFKVGTIEAKAIYTPGHTPACMSYLIGDAVFVGDTLFMPDYGTARCDFPGGDAHALYASVQRLFTLPPETRMFTAHDYQPGGREPAWETTVGEQKAKNVQIREGISEDEFVAMRQKRDATLAAPVLILPSLQVNIRGGDLPDPSGNGRRYLKIPLNAM
ncbi:MBL fold metallo-hydrolase [Acidiphilium acidophilum]|uniref:MBL fold metallo-hydrolase n=1 Tax=Acidiphilium acidophilum TaxID=76588 RepID=A0AAW9DNT1_ACIAO|nr:MBL fold metallo-hydrolase [Acidiphilium acidophilum]MDX5930729.1 MBL fold metallo-hydrolase [Acidiphilium acidophilum]GBQ20694.1 metallo-beta-lactamase [Acidiphilium acidophilum DSM 700]